GRTAPLGFRLRHVPLLERFDLANFILLACLRNCEFGVYSQEKPRRRGVRRGFGVPLGGTVIAGDNHTTLYRPIGRVTKIVISDGLDKDGLCPARTKKLAELVVVVRLPPALGKKPRTGGLNRGFRFRWGEPVMG